MAISDEINDCSYNEEAGLRIRGRDQQFCDSVLVQGGFTVGEGLLPPPPLINPLPTPAGSLRVKNTAQVGDELRIGEGAFVSFKKSPLATQITDYVLPSYYPTVSGQVLSSSTSGEMQWVTGGGSGPSGNQDYGFITDPA
jgi:hypothetical protein